MAWGLSSAFRQIYSDMIANACAFDWDADTIKGALYNNSITPDKNVTAANTAYNAGQWATANEVTGTNWAAGGLTLAGKTNDVSTNGQITIDANDLTATGTTLTAYGILVYDDTLTTPVAKQGFGYHSFGGVATVTGGDFTVQWSVNGLQRITIS